MFHSDLVTKQANVAQFIMMIKTHRVLHCENVLWDSQIVKRR